MEQVEDGEEVFNADNSSSVLNTFVNKFNNEYHHQYLDEAFRFLNAHPIQQLIADWVPGNTYSIPRLSGTKSLAC